VSGKKQLRSHAIADTHPKVLLVASDFKVITHHPRDATGDLESSLPLPYQTCIEVANLIGIDRDEIRLQRLNIARAIDNLSHLLDRWWARENRLGLKLGHRSLWNTSCPGAHAQDCQANQPLKLRDSFLDGAH
jgi:hypothetical protein